jgi:tetraacyldisaccharide 4'-kinase
MQKHPPSTLSHRWAARLQRSWIKRDWLAAVLYPVSLLYRAAIALRRWLYARGIFESQGVRVPVVIVGNVVAGGAGKTPVVIEIVLQLQAQGWQPGVVSRGYGREHVRNGNNNSPIEVTATLSAAHTGDEPAFIHRATQVPVWVGRNRAGAAQALLAAHPSVNVIISDDGLQHLALRRDIEICVFDQRGTGNGWLLPAGPLRELWPRSSRHGEPWPRSSRHGEPSIDFVLHTHTTPPAADKLTGVSCHRITRQLTPYALRSDGSRVPLAGLHTASAKPLYGVAGIAQPEVFFSMLRAAGLTLAHTEAHPDHYNFNSYSSNKYMDYQLICTEKDAIKLWQHCPQALAMPLLVDLPTQFTAALVKKLSSLIPST